MTKILIFGANGMLGHKLVQQLSGRFDVFGTIRGTFETVEKYNIFDRTKIIESVRAQDIGSLERAIESAEPDVVINAIGIIKQLPTAKDVITALEVNSILPHRLADLSVKYRFRLITISTDCVFDGVKGSYLETDIPNANELYGKSKDLGEVVAPNCLTIRTSIIGRELSTDHSLIEWFLSNRCGSVGGFVNAIYTGFPTNVFADIIGNLIIDHKDLSGLYHVASNRISKFDLLEMVNEHYQAKIEVIPREEPRIDRSLDAHKFAQATGFVPPSWNQMVQNMAGDATPYDSYQK